MMVEIKNHLGVWLGSAFRGLAVVGLTFFSLAIQSGISSANLETGCIAGGLYMFIEIAKYYKITIPTTKNKKNYSFLLFP
jgi:hypothetical protein